MALHAAHRVCDSSVDDAGYARTRYVLHAAGTKLRITAEDQRKYIHRQFGPTRSNEQLGIPVLTM